MTQTEIETIIELALPNDCGFNNLGRDVQECDDDEECADIIGWTAEIITHEDESVIGTVTVYEHWPEAIVDWHCTGPF